MSEPAAPPLNDAHPPPPLALQGRILYLGYDYSEPVVPWVHALVAATLFADYNTTAPPPAYLAASLQRS